MKKGSLLNSDLCRVISLLGHTDMLTVADAGLPIPHQVERIDLAVVQGLPSFMQVVEAITKDMQVEAVIIAIEMKSKNNAIYQQLLQYIELLEHQQANKIMIEHVEHESFKEITPRSKAVVRTGECSPYANVHFISGVTF